MQPNHTGDALTELRAWASIEIRMETGNLFVQGRVAGDRARRVRCVLTQRENVIHEERFTVEEFSEGVSFRDIPVRVWMPHGAGDQALYTLRVELLDERDAVLDAAERRVGFKHVAWEPGEGAELGTCDVNGRPIALHSAAWTPVHAEAEAAIRERLMRHKDAGVNLLRLGPDAFDEPERFYDLCDELGLMLWPAFPPDVTEAIARSAVLRRQHHAGLLLWSGRGAALAQLVDRLDPTHRFVLLPAT